MPNSVALSKKDYALVSFIGVSFALFSLPIINNLKLSALSVNATTAILLVFVFLIIANMALFASSVIAKKIPVILQIAKFAAVGAFNTFLDWGIVNLLIAATGIAAGVQYAIFNVISFIVANTGSYFWNKHWTFNTQSKKESGKDTVQFFAVTIISLGMKVGIASLVTNVIATPDLLNPTLWANIGLAFGTLFSLVWNFLGYKFFVFKK